MDKHIPTCLAIVCLTIIELYALYQQVNGTVLSVMIAGIAGLGGYTIKLWRDKKRKP